MGGRRARIEYGDDERADRYLRKYPHTLLAPLSLSMPDPAGDGVMRFDAESLTALPDELLQALIRKTLRPGTINLQKYISDQGGYPLWHCELYPKTADAQSETLHRTLLWTIYLNDGFPEGETEFLHQHRKITTQTGALLIAPAAFTHTHRGNMPKVEIITLRHRGFCFSAPRRSTRRSKTRQNKSPCGEARRGGRNCVVSSANERVVSKP